MRKVALVLGLLAVVCLALPDVGYAGCGGCGSKPKAAIAKKTCPLSMLAKLSLTDAQKKKVGPLKGAYLKAVKGLKGKTCAKSTAARAAACQEFCTKLQGILTAAQKQKLLQICPLKGSKAYGSGCAPAAGCKPAGCGK